MIRARWAAAVAVCACMHERPRPSPELRRLPVRVAEDVMAEPQSLQPRAQIFRDALVAALREEGFCVDRRGDFEATLQLDASVTPGSLTLTLIVDKATGVRLDVGSEQIDAPLPQSPERAKEMLRPLMRWLENSAAVGAVAEDSEGCRGCCL